MTNKYFAATTLSLAAAFYLSACGGGSGSSVGSTISGANFKSTDDVAIVVSSIGSALGEIDLGDSGFDSSSVAKPSPKAMHGAMQKSGSRPKAATACDAGGTIDSTPDAATAYSSDGSVVYNNCKYTSSNGTFSTSDTANGKASNKCTDSAQTTDSCNAQSIKIADGANGSATLDFIFKGTDTNNSSSNYDELLKLKADLVSSSSGNTDTTKISGTISFQDNIRKTLFTGLFDNLTSVSTQTTNSFSETVNGGFGVTSSVSKCSIGQVTIKTNSPIITNSSGTTTAGNVSLTDGAKQTATVQFNSDGGYTVTLGNGSSKTYSANDIENLCD